MVNVKSSCPQDLFDETMAEMYSLSNVPKVVQQGFTGKIQDIGEILTKALKEAKLPEETDTRDVLVALYSLADSIFSSVGTNVVDEKISFMMATDPLARFVGVRNLIAARVEAYQASVSEKPTQPHAV